MIEVYCDGAASKNGTQDSIGGWAYIVKDQGSDSYFHYDSGFKKIATNQQMEITAALKALQHVTSNYPFIVEGKESVTIYSDSAYVVNCINQLWWKNWERNGWINSSKKPVANKELWEGLLKEYKKIPFCDFIKVQGHSGNKYNEIVDELAVSARLE